MKKVRTLSLILIALILLATGCSQATTPTTTAAPAVTEAETEAPTEAATEAETEAPTEAETEAADAVEKIIIGVTPNPHETLVKLVEDQLKEKGIELEIVVFTDYVTPNPALNDGELDANYFQHIPYFDDAVEKDKLEIEILGGIHIEPMGVYSTSIESLDDLKDGDEVLIPNDTVNGGRALLLLQANGVIELKDGGSVTSTERDIVTNDKNLKFTPLEAATIPLSYEDAAIGVINGNYALDNGLNPVKDAIVLEDESSPYANIIAVRKGEAQLPKFQALLEALQSDEIKEFIETEYDGSVIPAFSKP